MDDKLSMNVYLDVIWKKTNAKIGILASIRRFISTKSATRRYKCMIRPHLDYIDFVINSGSANRIKKDIETLQEKYKIEDLRLRRKRNLVKIMCNQSMCTKNLKVETSKMRLQSANKVKIKKVFTNKTKVFNSPFYRGLRLWDSLPPAIQKEENKYVFKKKVSTYPL